VPVSDPFYRSKLDAELAVEKADDERRSKRKR
jgi:hypothetical protein